MQLMGKAGCAGNQRRQREAGGQAHRSGSIPTGFQRRCPSIAKTRVSRSSRLGTQPPPPKYVPGEQGRDSVLAYCQPAEAQIRHRMEHRCSRAVTGRTRGKARGLTAPPAEHLSQHCATLCPARAPASCHSPDYAPRPARPEPGCGCVGHLPLQTCLGGRCSPFPFVSVWDGDTCSSLTQSKPSAPNPGCSCPGATVPRSASL